MTHGRLQGDSRRLAALFLAVVAPPAVALVWLGLRMLESDRAMWEQRDLEIRQAVALAAVRSLEQSLDETERAVEGAPHDRLVRFTISKAGVRAEPAGSLLWSPVSPRIPDAFSQKFAGIERREFQGKVDEALAAYRELANSPDPSVRAGVLLRVARIQRRAGQWGEALASYRQLAAASHVSIDEVPADLVARRAVCSLLQESGRIHDLRSQAAMLEADLLSGKWMLDQPEWKLTVQQIEQWTGRILPVPAERKAFSEIAGWLWDEWSRNPAIRLPASTRRLVVADHTLLWQAMQKADVVVAIPPNVIRTWTRHAAQKAGAAGSLTLLTPSGTAIAGPVPSTSRANVKLPFSETGLPWTLVLSPANSSPEQLVSRRRMLSLGLAAIVLLLAGGSYFLWRVVQRELVVARLQTEFVATVSHEFRTPLTSLRHITELLDENDNMPAERRRSFYEALARNTERLHRLVESVLDFARMESGRKPYDLQPVDAAELASQVVSDFRREVAHHGVTVELDAEPCALPLRADAPSLTNALWNLLDNAVKYSPERDTVRVSVHRHPSGVAISVQDHGLGIPHREQSGIFRRFVRGEQASKLGIKGTGLGLAMVSHIVQAHGGAIELESAEGAGSTFRLVFPERS